MNLKDLFLEDDAVSSTIGVVLMVSVTVILAAAVGTFALGLAEESAEETPSASMEVKWGVTIISGTTYDTVDVTMLGGDAFLTKFATIEMDRTTIWDDSGTSSGYSVYGGKTWANDKVQSGDTLGLVEDSGSNFQNGDTVSIVWNNGQKSQVLGSGTLN
jgi:FlaG/FlaF family flagellin (archaellin)